MASAYPREPARRSFAVRLISLAEKRPTFSTNILPDNDLLLGFYVPGTETADEEDEFMHLDYYKLSEIRMEYRPVDMEEFYGGQEPD